MKDISILGCGWLGEPLAISLIEEGFHVKGSTTTPEKTALLEASNIEAYLVDITDFEEYDSFLNSDILIVAITSKDYNAFENLIEQIQNSPIQKVIFISSTSVYARDNKVISEDDAVIDSPLAAIEDLFRQQHFFETTIIRFAGLFGPDRHPGNWFSGDRKIPQPKGFVNMIHQEDCIEIIHQIIHKNCWNTTFNACSNHHPTRREFYTIAKVSKKKPLPVFEVNETHQWKIISSQKLQDTLDYTFIHDDLLEALANDLS